MKVVDGAVHEIESQRDDPVANETPFRQNNTSFFQGFLSNSDGTSYYNINATLGDLLCHVSDGLLIRCV